MARKILRLKVATEFTRAWELLNRVMNKRLISHPIASAKYSKT